MSQAWPPSPVVIALGDAAIVLGVAAPGIGAFVGALWRGWVGGLVGLFLCYVAALLTGISFVAQMTACRPQGGCHPPPPVPLADRAVELMQWAAGAYAVSWPNHLAWIGAGLVCLGAGLWVRGRRASS